MLKEIITKWLGEVMKDEKEFSAKLMEKQVGYSYTQAYNQAIQDLKSRIPELEERIEKEIQERLKNSWNKSIDENLPWDLGDALIAINTLKGVK